MVLFSQLALRAKFPKAHAVPLEKQAEESETQKVAECQGISASACTALAASRENFACPRRFPANSLRCPSAGASLDSYGVLGVPLAMTFNKFSQVLAGLRDVLP